MRIIFYLLNTSAWVGWTLLTVPVSFSLLEWECHRWQVVGVHVRRDHLGEGEVPVEPEHSPARSSASALASSSEGRGWGYTELLFKSRKSSSIWTSSYNHNQSLFYYIICQLVIILLSFTVLYSITSDEQTFNILEHNTSNHWDDIERHSHNIWGNRL